MTSFSIPPLITSILFASLGAAVYFNSPQTPENRSYSYLCLTTFLWQSIWTILFNLKDPHAIEFTVKIGYSCITFIPITFYHFLVNFLDKWETREGGYVKFSYFLGLLFSISIWNGNYFIDGYYLFPWGPYPKAALPLHPIYLVFLAILALRGIFLTHRSFKNETENTMRRVQVKYLFLATITYTVASIDFLTNYGKNIYPFGVFAILISLGIIAYATLRYKLMDFNLIFRWGLAYGSSLVFVGTIFVLILIISEKFFSSYFLLGKGIAFLSGACVAVVSFDPLRKQITKFVDKFIFKSPDFQILIRGMEVELKDSVAFSKVAEKLREQIKNIWGVDHAGFLIWDSTSGNFIPTPKSAFTKELIARNDREISQNDFLIKTLESERRLFKFGIAVKEELLFLANTAFPGERITFRKILRTMDWIGASACVPLMVHETLVGVIVLGEKGAKKIYNSEDKKFLSHVSGLISEFIGGSLREDENSDKNSPPGKIQ